MSERGKRVLGLVPLAALLLIAVLWRQGGVESDLARKSAASLGTAAASWVKLEGGGRDLVLTGEAPSPEARTAAIDAAAKPFGIRRVVDAMTLLPEAKPFTFTALRDGSKITLTGAVPSVETRVSLIEAAKRAAPGAAVIDETKAARGAPAAFRQLAEFGLDQLGKLGEGALSVSDLSLSLSGRAADFSKFAELKRQLASVPAGGKLAKGLGTGDILPPVAKPFTFSAERNGQEIVLSGFVPSEAARTRLIADARAFGGTVKDTLVVADGAPAGDWAGAAALLVRELGRLDPGRAGLADDKAAISGRGRDLVGEADVRADLKALPAGFALVQAAIESRAVRPYRFDARRGDGVVTLSGHVPDAKAKAEILDLAKRFFEGDKVEDQIAEGLGEPKEFLAAVRSGLQELARLAPGASFSLSDTSAALKGLALFDAARDQVNAAFRQGMPASINGTIEVATAPLPPEIADGRECQQLYRAALSRGTIHFRVGSAELSEQSRGILDRLTLVTLRCTTSRLEIGGHTDADGNSQSNAELSRRRAETVAVYFVRAGVPVARLEPVGYGQTVPVAPNDTAENKARNRRIEFTVR